MSVGGLTVPELLGEAEERSGLSDFGDPFFLDALNLLVESCRETAELNATGWAVLRKACVRHLRNRLALTAYFAARPEKRDEEIGAPIVITGLPRTGTTLLQELLALDPSHRVLRFWEALRPVPPDPETGPSEQDLVAQAQTWIDRLYEHSPAFRVIHPRRADGPEECDVLLQNSFASQHFDDMFRAEAYSAWLNRATLDREYADYARQLRALSQAPSRGLVWVLKSPSHLGYLDSLLRSFPGALIVQCHRDPTEAVASYASLVQSVRAPNSDAAAPEPVGEHALGRAAVACDRSLDVRAAVGRERFVDIPYSKLVDDPLDCVRAIYDRYGRALEHGESAAMTRWLAENPQHGAGVHRYSLERFGLTPNRVTAAFARYLDELRPALT